MNPFEFLNSINHKKNNLMVDEDTEKGYAPFMINRGLSYFQDTVLFANEMNTRSHIDSKLQYDFLREGIRSKKRFSKWMKKTAPASIETIKEYYGYSDAKAEAIADMVSPDDLKAMKKHLSKGGKR